MCIRDREFDQILAHVAAGLERYVGLDSSRSGDSTTLALACEQLLAEMERSYTTSEERLNHGGRGAAAPAAESITFF